MIFLCWSRQLEPPGDVLFSHLCAKRFPSQGFYKGWSNHAWFIETKNMYWRDIGCCASNFNLTLGQNRSFLNYKCPFHPLSMILGILGAIFLSFSQNWVLSSVINKKQTLEIIQIYFNYELVTLQHKIIKFTTIFHVPCFCPTNVWYNEQF